MSHVSLFGPSCPVARIEVRDLKSCVCKPCVCKFVCDMISCVCKPCVLHKICRACMRCVT
jgi:hypothetical protein